MEQDTRDEAGATRSQHLIHILARDDARAASLLTAPFERVEQAPASGQTQFLALAPDRDSVVAIAEALNLASREHGTPLAVPVSSVARAVDRLARGAAAVVVTPADALALIRRSALKLDAVRAAAVVWGDEMLREPAGRGTLEEVLAEVSRDAARLLLVSEMTEEVESFSTGFMWRARRMQHEPARLALPESAMYVVTPHAARGAVTRQLLDLWNPARAALVVDSDAAEESAAEVLRAIGYPGDDPSASVSRVPLEEPVDLAIVWDLPSDPATLAALGASQQVVLLVEPRSVPALARQAGENIVPLNLSQALREAHAAEDSLREELRGLWRGRGLAREILAIEPLLAEMDGVQVAAAALRLLDQERQRSRRAATAKPEGTAGVGAARREGPSAGARRGDGDAGAPRGGAGGRPPRGADREGASGDTVRVFVSAGDRDGVGPRELVGAITGEAGIEGSKVGRIDLRENHSIVEVARDVADRVIEGLNGISIKGRRVMARLDREPTPRGGASGSGGPRGGTSRGGPRSRSGGDDRGGRGRRDDRGGRERGGFRGRGEGRIPNAMREPQEWGERGDRLKHSRRNRRDEGSE